MPYMTRGEALYYRYGQQAAYGYDEDDEDDLSIQSADTSISSSSNNDENEYNSNSYEEIHEILYNNKSQPKLNENNKSFRSHPSLEFSIVTDKSNILPNIKPTSISQSSNYVAYNNNNSNYYHSYNSQYSYPTRTNYYTPYTFAPLNNQFYKVVPVHNYDFKPLNYANRSNNYINNNNKTHFQNAEIYRESKINLKKIILFIFI